MARLIEDLLSLSRIEQKQHLRPESIVDLTQTTRGVVDALTPMAQRSRRRDPSERRTAGDGGGRP